MKLPFKMAKMPNLFGKLTMFYGQHESTILTATSIGCSMGATTLALKNARYILGTIDIAKEMLPKCQNKDEETQLYLGTLKELIPYLGPVIALQVGSAVATVKLKTSTDKKIATLTEALAVANNAIAAYQVFQKEAEAVIPEEQMKEIQNKVAAQQVQETPQTTENTVNSPYANECYRYYDPDNERYFYSTLSPSAIMEKIHNLSIDFTTGNWSQYDDEGKAKVTHNDIWHLIDPKLMTKGGYVYGWTDNRLRANGTEASSDAIDVLITPVEDPNNPNNMVWRIQLYGGPLFRTRL